MEQQEIFDGVQAKLVDVLGVEPDEVTTESNLIRDFCIESQDFIDIRIQLESLFGIKIANDELLPLNTENGSILTIETIVDFVQ